MKILHVIRRISDEKDIIQKMATLLSKKLNEQGDQVENLNFKRKSILNILVPLKVRKYDVIMFSKVGIHLAFYSIFKKFKLIRKEFVVISYGSDIRDKKNTLINLFNIISKKEVNLLIVLNPDLLEIAKNRGYRKVTFVNSWVGGIV